MLKVVDLVMALMVMVVVVDVVVLLVVKVFCRGGSSNCGSNPLVITCLAGCPCLSFASSCCL